MTLLHVTNQLVAFFSKEHVLSKEDFSMISVDAKLEDVRDSVILTALEHLIEMGIVKKIVNQDAWIMSVPPGLNGQEISISLPVATAIADTINTFYKANNIDANPVDALDLGEGHIIALIEILHDLINEQKE